MAKNPYDDANKIMDVRFPAQRAANSIMGSRFPADATASRILAGAGFIPRRGSVITGTARTTPLGMATAGGLRSGPHYVQDPSKRLTRSPLGKVVAGDVRAGAVVNIQVWAGLMQENGITSETILQAYETAGGSADLSAEQRAGDTSDFLGDFVTALEHLGADPAIVVATYQQAGGLGGLGAPSAGGGGRGGSGGGFLGDAMKEAGRATRGIEHATREVADQIKKVFGF